MDKSRIPEKMDTFQSRVEGRALDSLYKSGATSGDCNPLFEQLARMSPLDRYAAAINMVAINAMERVDDSNIPDVRIGDSGLQLPACRGKVVKLEE